MGVALLQDERVLWQGSPAHRSVFLSVDPAWMWFSVKFDAVLFAVLAAIIGLLNQGLGVVDGWSVTFFAAMFAGSTAFYFIEPFAWRFLTLRRTTYYVTDQRVVSVPGRRPRSVPLAEIDTLAFAESDDGSGYIRLYGRHMPDGFGNGTVAELIHVPDVREVVDLLSRLTGKTPVSRRP
ncbi:PH domain-containing protein [Lentzea sp. NPDC051838]|uniref:PH domain-containing protein n=1 Tax=Lentzea sp. NPDC051838 TaxID=3154849 RepID=UPI003449FB87